MITCYHVVNGVLKSQPIGPGEPLPASFLWVDLLEPSQEEEQRVERALGVDIPTREEMAEIEDSSRLREQDGALLMTSTVVSGIGAQRPSTAEVTFVLSAQWLVTVRYAELAAFSVFETKNAHGLNQHASPDLLLATLLDSIVDRIADVLEMIQSQLNSLSESIFSDAADVRQGKADLQLIVKHLGRHNSLLGKLSGSLLSITRQLGYVRLGASEWLREPARIALKSVERDVRSLGEHQAKISGEVTFLLDATLGLINIEQNSIIKVFSIAAVLFLPPTLLGTVYGMNFDHMPELHWAYGYPLALAMMVASAAASYAWFKFKNWL
ncbi:magnesium transporter [Stutzerimonas nosocomialis]|uniref:magnesium transporter CorA family protein n=1 Tax=Stutzerimonas nosocomialis TaxID=1056496 RepID=UPI0011098041|nr:magnesium transporter CorA family protein [Stutzerimonas nosocomialis]TLX58726.1 magnesium transporter [Stutzerimonas nosocomialis]